jgi:hypothetical protein
VVWRALGARAGLAAALLISGCGGSHVVKHHAVALRLPQGCAHAAIATLARTVGVSMTAVRARLGEGNNGEPQCELQVATSGVSVVINLDSAPQTYSRFERIIAEYAQGFPVRRSAAPQNIDTGLGGAWLPTESEFVTTDGHRLITVTVAWRGARARALRSLAVSEGRLYLGPSSKTARMEEF